MCQNARIFLRFLGPEIVRRVLMCVFRVSTWLGEAGVAAGGWGTNLAGEGPEDLIPWAWRVPKTHPTLWCGVEKGPWHCPAHCPSAGEVVSAGPWAPASSLSLLPP